MSILTCFVGKCFTPTIGTAFANLEIPSGALERLFIKGAVARSAWDFKTIGECALWEGLSLYNANGECFCVHLRGFVC